MSVPKAEVKRMLEKVHHEENMSYTTSAKLARRTDYSPRKWGRALREAERDGLVEEWSKTNNITWRITL